MKRRKFLAGLAALSLADSTRAQPRIRRVSVVTIGDVREPPLSSFVEGLAKLGYEEGRNLELLLSTADGTYMRLAEAAKVAVQRQPEVIVTEGSTATRAAKAATSTIPIVMVVGVDPVEHGFVRQLARPGGNISGIAHSDQLLAAKRLELLKEILPRIKKIGALWSGDSPQQGATLKITEAVAAQLGIGVVAAEARQPGALSSAFAALGSAKVEAVVLMPNVMFAREAAQIARLAATHKVVSVWSTAGPVRVGGFMAYGADRPAQWQRAAVFVDRILKGARPADLPVEQPTKFELVINLKTAKALGIEIPKTVLFRADEVIQ